MADVDKRRLGAEPEHDRLHRAGVVIARAEIGQERVLARLACVGHEDVRGLEVPMDDLALVDEVDRLRDLLYHEFRARPI